MKTVYGLEAAREVLSKRRGFDLEAADPDVVERNREIFGQPFAPLDAVRHVIDRVRADGDAAVLDLTERLDGYRLDAIEVPAERIKRAAEGLPRSLLDALKTAAERVERFQRESLHFASPDGWMNEEEGYGERLNAVDSAGIYVPGGNARFPSTVLMTAIPARVAGVRNILVCTPTSDGVTPDATVLAAAQIAGVERVFQVGGAQAIAALAYGTETIPAVDMVCGPGSVYTTLAKKLVYGDVGIDGLYGPTETLLIADETANPTLCAADLVAQAEHDPLATPVFITTSSDVASAVEKEASLRASRLARSSIAMASLERRGQVVVVDSVESAIQLANEFAPEHLSLMVAEPRQYLDRVRSAGAIFLGEFSHEVLGDYVAGPSHVMPTGGTARFSSGVNVRTFLKVSAVVGIKDSVAAELSRPAAAIARAEGFTGHAEAAEIRDELSTLPKA